MAEPFLGEVRMFGFDFAPRGWAFCDGQILPISQNQSLYSLLGTTYGGDGKTSFALPDLRGRVPFHVGEGYREGDKGGEEAHVLSAAEMPEHAHAVSGSSGAATTDDPTGNLLAGTTSNVYVSPAPASGLVDLNAGAAAPTGGSQAHQNMQPYLVVNFAIALQGLFPSRN